MIKQMFLIKDTKAEVYSGPFTSVNLRTFERECATLKGSDTQFGKHPQDFAIYTCGSVNDSTGVIESTPPVHVINMDDLFNSAGLRGE